MALGLLDPVGEVLGRLSRRQLVYWMAFLEREPLAVERDDVRHALYTAKLCNRFPGSAADPVDPNDLIIDWKRAAEEQAARQTDPDQQREAKAQQDIEAILARFG